MQDDYIDIEYNMISLYLIYIKCSILFIIYIFIDQVPQILFVFGSSMAMWPTVGIPWCDRFR